MWVLLMDAIGTHENKISSVSASCRIVSRTPLGLIALCRGKDHGHFAQAQVASHAIDAKRTRMADFFSQMPRMFYNQICGQS